MSQTILIVEHDQPTRELYEREIGAEYPVLACASERDAFAAFQRHQIGALILEPTLSNGDGWDLLRRIRAMPEQATLPIILCSTQSAHRQALAMGATMYLVKPVLPFQLLDALRQVLAGHT